MKGSANEDRLDRCPKKRGGIRCACHQIKTRGQGETVLFFTRPTATTVIEFELQSNLYHMSSEDSAAPTVARCRVFDLGLMNSLILYNKSATFSHPRRGETRREEHGLWGGDRNA